MFYLLIALSVIGYSLQGTLMASFYRRMDLLSAVAYRGLTLGVTMLPVLIVVPQKAYLTLPEVLLPLLFASACAVVANCAIAQAYHYLPVGITSAFCFTFSTLISTVLAYFFYAEYLTIPQLIVVVLLLSLVVTLGALRSSGDFQGLDIRKGVLYSLLFGFFISLAYLAVAGASRLNDAILIGYLWEFTIGLMALGYALLRGIFSKKVFQVLSVKETVRLGLYSAPTVVGTATYALATTLGPVGLVSAGLSLIMVASAFFAQILYGEKLSRTQICVVVLIGVLLCSMKVVGP